MLDRQRTANAGAPVVVGIDGSPGALAAVGVAGREAALRHRPLRIVQAFDWPTAAWATTPGWTAPPRRAYRERARKDLTDAIDAARKIAPAIDITSDVIPGDPAGVLLNESSTPP